MAEIVELEVGYGKVLHDWAFVDGLELLMYSAVCFCWNSTLIGGHRIMIGLVTVVIFRSGLLRVGIRVLPPARGHVLVQPSNNSRIEPVFLTERAGIRKPLI